jgi:hypothetical protein
MIGEDVRDDLAWEEVPFDARITAAEEVDGVWHYALAELTIGHATDELAAAEPGRVGPARERNNEAVAVGTIVSAQFRGVFEGQPLYEFSHCCSECDDCGPCFQWFEMVGPCLPYIGPDNQWRVLDLTTDGTITVTGGVLSITP